MSNDFPKLGINTQALIDDVIALIEKARDEEDVSTWGVNWGDIGIASIEYRKEMLDEIEAPYCAVILEEASPGSELSSYVYSRIKDKYPNVEVHCEW